MGFHIRVSNTSTVDVDVKRVALPLGVQRF